MKKLEIAFASLFFAPTLSAQDISSAVNSITPEDIRAKIGVIAQYCYRGRTNLAIRHRCVVVAGGHGQRGRESPSRRCMGPTHPGRGD